MPPLTTSVAVLQASGPILAVELGNSLTGQRALQQRRLAIPSPIQVRAFVDTGADMCVIGDGFARQLSLTLVGLQILAASVMAGPSPGFNIVPEYSARLVLPNGAGFEITAIEVPLPSGLQMLIGRDVLARGMLHYDGLHDAFTLTF